MVDEKITDYTAQTGAGTATGDLIEIVDVSDTTMDATGTNKKMTADELAKALATTLGVVGRDKLWDTKGDLAVATGADAASILAVGADGTELVADSTQTTGLAWKQRSRSVSDAHTDSSAVNTTTETVVASRAVPTSVGVGDIVRLTAYGDSLNNSGAAVTYTLKAILGATTVLTSNANSIVNSANRRQWMAEIEMLVVATNDERVGAFAFHGAASASGWSMATNSSGVGRGTATEDLTAGKNLQLSITMGTAAGSVDFVCHESWLEVIKR